MPVFRLLGILTRKGVFTNKAHPHVVSGLLKNKSSPPKSVPVTKLNYCSVWTSSTLPQVYHYFFHHLGINFLENTVKIVLFVGTVIIDFYFLWLFMCPLITGYGYLQILHLLSCIISLVTKLVLSLMLILKDILHNMYMSGIIYFFRNLNMY